MHLILCKAILCSTLFVNFLKLLVVVNSVKALIR